MIEIEREMVSLRMPGGYYTKSMSIKFFRFTIVKLNWTFDGK